MPALIGLLIAVAAVLHIVADQAPSDASYTMVIDEVAREEAPRGLFDEHDLVDDSSGLSRPETAQIAPSTDVVIETKKPQDQQGSASDPGPQSQPAASQAATDQESLCPSNLYCAYTVQAGDTLSGIAAMFGLEGTAYFSAGQLISLSNGLPGGGEAYIQPGQELLVPAHQGILHTVLPAEILSALAASYGIPMMDILAANGMEDPNALLEGQVLLIPSPTTSPALSFVSSNPEETESNGSTELVVEQTTESTGESQEVSASTSEQSEGDSTTSTDSSEESSEEQDEEQESRTDAANEDQDDSNADDEEGQQDGDEEASDDENDETSEDEADEQSDDDQESGGDDEEERGNNDEDGRSDDDDSQDVDEQNDSDEDSGNDDESRSDRDSEEESESTRETDSDDADDSTSDEDEEDGSEELSLPDDDDEDDNPSVETVRREFSAGYRSVGGSESILDHILEEVIPCESGYNVRAFNPAGPFYGLMQFLAETWLRSGGGNWYDARQQGENTARLLMTSEPRSQWPHCW